MSRKPVIFQNETRMMNSVTSLEMKLKYWQDHVERLKNNGEKPEVIKCYDGVVDSVKRRLVECSEELDRVRKDIEITRAYFYEQFKQET